MTITDIRTRLSAIELVKGDPETAHSMEDRLMRDFIKQVMESDCLELALLAHEVLKSDDIDFERRFA